MFAQGMIARSVATAWFVCATSSALASPTDVFGFWRTEAGSSIVEIADCGDGSPCGTVRWLDPDEVAVSEDVNNPDPELARRSLLGLLMLSGFERSRRGWSNGEIYDPERGKTFGSKLRRLDDGRLEVKGCVAFFCQTQIWTPEAAATPQTPQ